MKNKGITLIAMVITVLVMIILAGITITLNVGNNSILSQGEIAIYQNSITQIEQKINEFYVQNYNDMPKLKNKAISLIMYFEIDRMNSDSKYKKNWIDTNANVDTLFHKRKSIYNRLGDDTIEDDKILTKDYQEWTEAQYNDFDFSWQREEIINKESKVFYILNLKNLKEIFGDEVEVLDLNPNYSKLTDVYAITSDLKVFYMANGLKDVIGIKTAELEMANKNAIIFDANSEMSKDLNEGSAVTKEHIKSVKNFTISSTSNLTNLNDVGKLSSVQEMTVNNSNIKDLKGIEGASSSLKILWLFGNELKSFSGIEKCKNLEALYLRNFNDEQLAKLCETMAKGNYSKLKTIAISGYWSVGHTTSSTTNHYSKNKNTVLTNISPLAKLTATTRGAVQNLIINNNGVTSASAVANFPNLKFLKLESNNITSLDGIKNHSKLTHLKIANNNLKSDALNDLVGLGALSYLDLRANYNLVNVEKVATLSKLSTLWFRNPESLGGNDSDKNLSHTEVYNIKDFLNKLGSGLEIDPSYSLDLLDSSKKILSLKDEKIPMDSFKNLANHTQLTHLSINNVQILDKNDKVIESVDEVTEIINETLGSLKKVRYLQILNMPKLNSIEKVSEMKYLIELDVRKCNNITDFKFLNSNDMNVSRLAIDNVNIDLTTIQPAINKLGKTPYKIDDNGNYVLSKGAKVSVSASYWSKGTGLVLATAQMYRQLENCTELTRIHMNRDWQSQIGSNGNNVPVDLTRLTKLTYMYSAYISCDYKMPSSLVELNYGSVTNNKGTMDLSLCVNLKILKATSAISERIFLNMINSIPDNNIIESLELNQQTYLTNFLFFEKFANSTTLKTVKMPSSTHNLKITSIEGLNKVKSLEYITITHAVNLKELPDMSELQNLKSLSITNSALEGITPETKIRELPNLKSLYFTTNSISDISGLIPEEDSHLQNLELLQLGANCLYNESSYTVNSKEVYSLVDTIFIPLHEKKLRKLYLVNNPNFTDTEKLKALKWTEKSGF